MPILKKIKELDKIFAWSFLGFIIGIVSLFLAIYITYFQDNGPKIKYEIITNTNILDLKENITKLDILYNGSSIGKDNNTLRIVTFKLANIGNSNILKNDYDEDNPLGFIFQNGEIVDTPILLNASSDYLMNSFRIQYVSPSSYKFSNVIFEKGEYVEIKVLALCKKNITPHITPVGKIAGVKEFSVIENFNNNNNEMSFINKVLFGGFFIHVLRFVFYVLVIIFGSITIFLPISLISDKLETHKRKRILNKFKKTKKYDANEKYQILYESYLGMGISILKKFQKKLLTKPQILVLLVKDKPEKMMNEHKLFREDVYEVNLDDPGDILYQRYPPTSMSVFPMRRIVLQLIKSGVLAIEGNELKILDGNLNIIIQDFIDYIDIIE